MISMLDTNKPVIVRGYSQLATPPCPERSARTFVDSAASAMAGAGAASKALGCARAWCIRRAGRAHARTHTHYKNKDGASVHGPSFKRTASPKRLTLRNVAQQRRRLNPHRRRPLAWVRSPFRLVTSGGAPVIRRSPMVEVPNARDQRTILFLPTRWLRAASRSWRVRGPHDLRRRSLDSAPLRPPLRAGFDQDARVRVGRPPVSALPN